MNLLRHETLRSFVFGLFLMYLAFINVLVAQEHPSLILTKIGVEEIRGHLGNAPVFDATLSEAKKEIDKEIAIGIKVPLPKDFSGGYTHERHKRNFLVMQKAGVLFQILKEEKYAIYIRDMLFAYEEMYLDLPVHPQERSYARGKIFWQCLNDSNWLVYVSQAYDCIYEWLEPEERLKLEENLFRPFADFISRGNPQFYNRVHNHSTWGNAAVGMIALAMNDDELLERALNGLKEDNLAIGAKDDDGGFIKVEGQKTGFLANLDEPFSPDGYYTEGPYYQRYAMYPFLIFAQALHNVKPELKIFERKDSVLLRSVNTLLNLTDADGEFFPLNDGQKGMSYHARELVTAVDIAYHFGGNNPQLLSIAEKQDRVVLDDTGMSVALAIRDGKAQPFQKKSVKFNDGPKGKQGGVGVLRYGEEELTLVFKYGAQGLSHGHYDKLSFSLYEKGEEVIQDYGLARFVNIEQKGGGNYLKENASWAKQTIAHNTVTQNETSHFKGSYEIGSKNHSELLFFDASDNKVQLVSAKETNAYPNTEMHRTMAMIKDKSLEKPYVLDIIRLSSNKKNKYDLPFYFMGQLMETNFEYEMPQVLTTLGDDNGYQHLWVEGKGAPIMENTKLSWLHSKKFYTITTITELSDELFFTRLGANDPDFNLRRDAALMLRRKDTQNTLFVTVIEPHGHYSPVSEFAVGANSNVAKVAVLYNDADYTAVVIDLHNGNSNLLIVSNQETSTLKGHVLNVGDKAYKWEGPYYFNQIN
ncbi:alginate lyase family protein [Spongiimicrobium sp. 3-5]|uniref:alginate lyase family protein n=1 Tax=Spongiimicrobium sp. 3-5 TaxID=3332596 RepID=UPI00397EC893